MRWSHVVAALCDRLRDLDRVTEIPTGSQQRRGPAWVEALTRDTDPHVAALARRALRCPDSPVRGSVGHGQGDLLALAARVGAQAQDAPPRPRAAQERLEDMIRARRGLFRAAGVASVEAYAAPLVADGRLVPIRDTFGNEVQR